MVDHALVRREAVDLAFDIYRAIADAMTQWGVHNLTSAVLKGMTAITINDGLAAVATLIDSNGQAHAPTVVRSMIESLLDLALLCKDGAYRKPLLLSSLRGTHRYVELMVGSNDLDAQTRERLREVLQSTGCQIRELETEGIERMEITDKLRCSGLEPKLLFYVARYNGSAHSNFEALLDRHHRDGELQIGDTLPDWQAIETLSIAAAVAAEVLRYVPKFAPCPATAPQALHDTLFPKLQRLASASTDQH